MPRILVTAASGQLGRLVVAKLLESTPAAQVVAGVRNLKKSAELSALGVEVREADYSRPETLDPALAGIDRVLLISSSEVGRRVAQHRNVIEAARRAGVELLAYTSVLRADTTELLVGVEHRETEVILQASGVPFVFLRNGWYTENRAAFLPHALEHGQLPGCAGEGRFSWAARVDYADAAAVVMTTEGHAGRIYELAGDKSDTLSDFAAEVALQAGKPLAYRDMPEEDFRSLLVGAGIPDNFAELLANSDAVASRGGLFDESRQMSRLIGRPTTPLSAVVAEIIKS
ncbi:SDR family oxidoreductase [Singulisphaera sp. PoT]|uniref:SDR family oxidoreductase n=1 Tax=Singulisphaera sp. PoT TaxID=3411797 RepID=UPI003BF5A4DE